MKHPTPTWYDCVAAVASTIAAHGYRGSRGNHDWSTRAWDYWTPDLIWWNVAIDHSSGTGVLISVIDDDDYDPPYVRVDVHYRGRGGIPGWHAQGYDETAEDAKARTIEALTLLHAWEMHA